MEENNKIGCFSFCEFCKHQIKCLNKVKNHRFLIECNEDTELLCLLFEHNQMSKNVNKFKVDKNALRQAYLENNKPKGRI